MIGIGIGAIILSVAAGGGAEDAPLRFEVLEAVSEPGALGGDMPDKFPAVIYLRDRPVLPAGAKVLARDSEHNPLAFAIGKHSLGFAGHPGMKSAMIEDIIMEFDETPDGSAQTLGRLREVQFDVADSLSGLMVGIVRHAGLMNV